MTSTLDPRYREPGPRTFRGHEVPPPGDVVVFWDDRKGAKEFAFELGTYAKHSLQRHRVDGVNGKHWHVFSVVRLPDDWRDLPGAGE